jgi:membrane associated rhomboid family serine protease
MNRYGFDPGGGYDPFSRVRRSSMVKLLIIINVAVYLFELLAKVSGQFGLFVGLFALIPELVTTRFFVWQFLTAMFLHADFFHILFNMLGLFFFGPEMEWLWGKTRFLFVYLGIGVAANIFAYVLDIHATSVLLGASGATLGILGAYAACYPNRQVIFFIFPVKVKWLVLVYFVVSLLATMGLESGGGIASSVHLAGIVLGVLFVKFRWRLLATLWRRVSDNIRYWYLRVRYYRTFKVLDGRKEEERREPWKN